MTDPLIETVDLVEPWLYATLSGDSTLAGLVAAVSGTLSATPLPLPFVSFAMQSSLDVTGFSGDRISTDDLYQVKATGLGSSWDEVRPIARRIDALLHRPNMVVGVAGGSLSCIRERTLQYPEVSDGLEYRHLGGIYRIRASAGA